MLRMNQPGVCVSMWIQMMQWLRYEVFHLGGMILDQRNCGHESARLSCCKS